MSTHEAAFEYHHRRWWIFNTFQEAVDYFAANVLPIAEGAGE